MRGSVWFAPAEAFSGERRNRKPMATYRVPVPPGPGGPNDRFLKGFKWSVLLVILVILLVRL